MASNPDFMKAVFNDIEMVWPRLDQTYKFDHVKGESIPVQPTAQGAAWSVSVVLDKERADNFRAKAEEHYNLCRSRNSQLPDFSGVFGMKKKDGTYSVSAKRMGVNNQGERNDPPKVVDEYHEPIADRAIWSGSKGSVSVLAHPSTNPQTGLGGISLVLRNILVTEPRYGSDGLEDDFGAPKARSASHVGDSYMGESENPGHGMDDEIPF
jgi:hypothetical protein